MKAPSRAGAPDTGSMPMAMLITVVGVLLSGVVASTMAVQLDSTRSALLSQRALEAAQTGLDVALGHIRAATNGTDSNGFDDNGVLSKLPCGPLTGTVSGAGAARYTVDIVYSSIKNGASITCHGTKGPAFANIISKGTDPVTGATRTLRGTYAFRTTNRNIAGGAIHVYKTATSLDLCMHAGDPVGGPHALVAQACSNTPGDPSQTFAYNPNLTITLISSITDALPLGRCVDAGALPHDNNEAVTLQPCGATTLPRQQWSFNDSGNFEGTKETIQEVNGVCLNILRPNDPGSPVVLKSTGGCGTAYTNVQNFNPDPEVGAGAAGHSSGQLVNYRQFGRCLDVPGRDYLRGYVTAWPCKQAPNATNITWNQKWQLPAFATGASSATGTISTQPDYTAFRVCLTSPLTTGSTAYARLTQCPVGVVPSMQWTVNGDTGTYDSSFTIVDTAGNCLSAADPNNPATVFHTSGNKISRGVMLPCSGSTFQKWNADPYVLRPRALTDIAER